MATNHSTSLQDNRKTHRQNMLNTLLHRIEVAKANGNQTLVTLLENEQKELGLW
jgi:hypothetical protein